MSDEKAIALVTGASSGLGVEFCRQLAPRCRKLILVARRRDKLEALAGELRGQGVEPVVVAADLCDPLGVTEVVETIRQQGPVTILVNNAGFGTLGRFAETDFDSQQAMVDLHINASLRLCRAVIPYMREAGAGSIVNLSSLASLFPMREVAVYCASKVFLNAFSEALQQEEKKYGIRVQSLCPGYTHTEFHDRESFESFDKASVPEAMWMDASDVVRESLTALDGDGEVVYVAGENNRQLLGRHT